MIQSLERAFLILEAFQGEEKLGITQLSQLTGLPKTTVHRIVRTLEGLNYLEKDQETEKYQLGVAFARLARAALERPGWRQVARNVMRDLSGATGESVYLGVLHGISVVFVDEAVSSRPVRVGSSIGMHAPLHVTAAGKALLAALPPEERDVLLDQLAEAYAPRPGAGAPGQKAFSREGLLAELEAVRRNGYAVSDRAWHAEACYVAAAIMGAAGRPLAAISLGAPAVRLPPDKWEAFGRQVAHAAARVSLVSDGSAVPHR